MSRWFKHFERSMKVVFDERAFERYSEMVKSDLDIYKKYLKPNAEILDCGCGLGCVAVPLSNEGYRVTGIDNDEKVIECAKINGKNFGKGIEFKFMDIFDVDKEFGENSFDACIHGGVLEHFSEDEIKVLLDKQLKVSPTIICSFPIRTEAFQR